MLYFNVAQTGKHLLRAQNVSEQNQKLFCVPECIRNKCCVGEQTGKRLCRQQCRGVRNNVSSFARAFNSVSSELFCLILLIMSSKRQIGRQLLQLQKRGNTTSENDFRAV